MRLTIDALLVVNQAYLSVSVQSIRLSSIVKWSS